MSILGFAAVGFLSLVGVDVNSVMDVVSTSFIAPAVKGVVAFPLIYHYIGGVRHMIWDKDPETLTNEKVEDSSKFILGFSALTAATLAFM